MRFRLLMMLLLPALIAMGISCSGGSNNSSSASSGSAAKATGPVLSDEDYLKALCSGVTRFSDALVSKSSADEISRVVSDFSASMKSLNPPADLQKFNADFAKYLDDAVSDPTSLLTRKPPLPADNVRKRLTDKESKVQECKAPTFFELDSTAVPATPAR